MRLITILCCLVSAVLSRAADTPRPPTGDWLLVNGVVVLQIAEDGTMTLRNTGAKGPLTLAKDGTFTWKIPDQPATTGKLIGDRLLLKSDQPNPPKWLQFLEFKKADKATAGEVIELALQQQTAALSAFAKLRESNVRTSVLNNLRQLAAAADQHFLEYGTSKVTYEQLVGAEKYIAKLTAVDGEDYTKLDLNQGSQEWRIVTASGLTVTYSR